MRLWLARHARPLIAEGICYGALDVEADEAETRDAAVRLAAELPRGIDVLASPLRRCAQLAEALRALRPDLVPRFDERLREMDFGGWEGRAWDLLRAELDAWADDFGGHRAGETGECVAGFVARVGALLRETSLQGRDCAWICHGGVYKAVLLGQSGIVPSLAAHWPRETLAWGAWQVFDPAPT